MGNCVALAVNQVGYVYSNISSKTRKATRASANTLHYFLLFADLSVLPWRKMDFGFSTLLDIEYLQNKL